MTRRRVPAIRDIEAAGQVLELEEAVRTSERLALIVQSHRDAILSIDLERRIRTWNPSAQRMFGYTAGEIIGRPVSVLAPPALHREVAAALDRAAREGHARLVTRRLRKDGGTVHVSVVVGALHDARGRVIGFSSTLHDISEQKRMMDELAASEEKFRALFDNGNDAVFLRELGTRKKPGRFTQVNRVACSRYGYAREELLKMSPAELDAGGMDAARERAIGTMMRTGRCVFEMTHRKKDGTLVPVEISSRVFTLQGRLQVLSIVRDVAERKRLESVLLAKEELYRTLFNSNVDGVLGVDVQSARIAFGNPAICRMFGYAAAEFTRLTAWDLHPADALPRVRAEFQALAQERKDMAAEIPCLRRDGTVFFADIHVGRMTVGGRAHLLGFFHDITRRRQTEAAVRESELRYRTLIDSSPVAICVLRLGRIVLVNRAFLSLYRYRCAEQVVGREPYSLVARERVREIRAQHARRMGGGAAPSYFESVARRKDGSTFPVAVNAGTIVLPEGPSSICYFFDLSSRKQAERQLRDVRSRLVATQEEERRRLSRDLHDGVGQLLSGAKYSLHSLAKAVEVFSPQSAARARKVADTLDRAVAEVRRVSWDLMPPELESMGLPPAIRTHCREFTERRGIPVTVAFEAVPKRLPSRMSLALLRIVQEALGNIAEHSRATAAAVRLWAKRGQLELSISDNGTGFVMERPVRKRERGAGLVNIQERVESLGGKFKLFSEPGRGTQLAVRIPLTAA